MPFFEKLQGKRSHGFSGNVIRENMGTHFETALKRNEIRKLLSWNEDDSAPSMLNSPYCRSMSIGHHVYEWSHRTISDSAESQILILWSSDPLASRPPSSTANEFTSPAGDIYIADSAEKRHWLRANYVEWLSTKIERIYTSKSRCPPSNILLPST